MDDFVLNHPDRRQLLQASPAAQPAPRAARRTFGMLTRAYALALMLVAATVLGTGWILNGLVARQAGNAEIIKSSGEQRMLSQRLAMLAPDLDANDVAVRALALDDFIIALSKMQAIHDKLTVGPDAASRNSPALSEHYFGAPDAVGLSLPLDARLRYFFANASALQLAAKEPQPATSDAIAGEFAGEIEALRAEAQTPLLAALDQAVTLHQAAADAEVVAALRFHAWAIAAAMLLLLAEALLIFRPLARRLADQARALEHDAHHDVLTGLLNRHAVAQRLAVAFQSQRAVAVITVDLDWFKQINESEGHEGGDAVLKTTATRLLAAVRKGDFVARVGGDEFSVFLMDCDSLAVVNIIAEHIRHALNQPVEFGERRLPMSATLGVALAPKGATDAAAVMRLADEALLQAKLRERGSIGLAHSQDGERIERARQIRQSIDALDPSGTSATDGLSVAFQPILQQDGSGTAVAVAGVEALARWTHPSLGVLSPGEFLPVAVQSGRMPALGHALMVRCLRDYAGLRAMGLDPGRLSLNLSPAELATAGFVEDFEQQVVLAGLDLSDLSLEITEEVLLERVHPQTLKQLLALHDRGARLVMDDFGTGTSGLSQLLALPFDTLKIDRVFVQALLAEPRAQTIVLATLSMANGLGLSVVAEGVETPPQAQALANLGCSLVQGFLFARPMPAAALADWLRACGLPTATPAQARTAHLQTA